MCQDSCNIYFLMTNNCLYNTWLFTEAIEAHFLSIVKLVDKALGSICPSVRPSVTDNQMALIGEPFWLSFFSQCDPPWLPKLASSLRLTNLLYTVTLGPFPLDYHVFFTMGGTPNSWTFCSPCIDLGFCFLNTGRLLHWVRLHLAWSRNFVIALD